MAHNKLNLKFNGIKVNRFSLNPVAACARMAIAGGMALGPIVSVQAELPVPRAVWESMGSVTREVLGGQMNIHQHTERAILNWESFNISEGNSVHFQQPGESAIVLNKIFQNDPSRILGSLTANGQVYLINRNGFLFGKDSTVDVRGLVASTLDVSEEVFTQGITKVFASNGSAAFQGNGDFYIKNPDGSFQLDAEGNKIKVKVVLEEGAQIKANDGQNILIIAPTITNKGHIEADDRQVILAAATDRVYLQEAGSDGLLVEVRTGGEINNLGSIASRRGKVTLIGFAVNQDGVISASTSTNINGTIRLLARENAQVFATPDGFALRATSTTRSADAGDGLGTSAKVSFGENSRTEILPELNDDLTAIDEQIQPLSDVEVMGHKIHMKSGAEINVPGGTVDLTATQNPINPLQNAVNRNDSRILIDTDAKIDVSGVDTAVRPMESNVVEVELRLNELKDSPLQRDGILFGKTVLVDIRQGTPLADIQDAIDAIPRTLGERLAKGGEINLGSEGDAIVLNNAMLDFSGGAVTFLDGFITTTKLTSDGRVFNISEAHPYVKYDAVYGEAVKVHEKWGVRKVWQVDGPFSLARREAGYIEGHDAGHLAIKSPNVILEGSFKGETVNGRLQRKLVDQAKGGGVEIDMLSAIAVTQPVIFSATQDQAGINLQLDDLFHTIDPSLSIALALQSDMLEKSGVQDISVATHGAVTVAEDGVIRLTDGGRLALQGSTIDVNGVIKGASAEVTLATVLTSQTINRPDAGSVSIGETANIDLQGGWVNDRTAPFHLIDETKVVIDGGRFHITANGDIDLRAGSIIDVSGGAWMNSIGKITEGEAGSVNLTAAGVNVGSNLSLDGTLKAFGLRQGGFLALEANAVTIGRRREGTQGGLRALIIEPEFFGQGGFSDYLITANINGLKIDEGTQIKLQQINRILDNSAINQASANSIEGLSRTTTLPAFQRMPSALTLVSNHAIGPNLSSHLIVNKNVVIDADPISSVSLVSDSALTFDGSIVARGGNVDLSIIPPAGLIDPLYQPTHGIWVGDHAQIDVSGIAITELDALGRRHGNVIDGGSITLDAVRGFIATQSGSLLDVSGTVEKLNLPRPDSSGFGLSFNPLAVGSNGGLISVSAADGIFLDGQMYAAAGAAAGTSGGRFAVDVDGKRREEPVEEGIIMNFPTAPGILNFSQENLSRLSHMFGQPGDALPVSLERTGHVSTDQISQGGFSSLTLRADDEVLFKGDVNLVLQHALHLDAPRIGWTSADTGDSGQVVLDAAHATIGSTLNRNARGNPFDGGGHLIINADLIELTGGAYTTGFNQVDFNAVNDIRLSGLRLRVTDRDFIGEFKTFSKLNLAADRLFPNTLTNFTLSVLGDVQGAVTFTGGGSNAPVLSAFSKLTVKAPNINQNGIVKAPFGEIFFDATNAVAFGAESITSVSPDNQVIPFGITEGGLEWLYPIGNQNLIVEAPVKNITITADKIQREEGALVDLSGGGDLMAFEFIPGVGGSRDVLATDQSFVIIPKLSGYAPFDPQEFPSSNLNIGDSIYLGEGSGLAAGTYTLLPARYALLPGAFLITPQAGTLDMVPGSKMVNLEGAPVVAGFRTIIGTGIRDQRWSGFAVEPGEIAFTRSQLNLTSANQFFLQQAIDNETTIPRLPQDAGHLKINARTQLDLPGVNAGTTNGGLPGLIDVVAENIAVVNIPTHANNIVEIKVSDLDSFEIGSLLLGGTRTFNTRTGAIELDVNSKSVELGEGVVLQGSEIILAATDRVALGTGSTITASGKHSAQEQSTVLQTNGDGALLRVASGGQASLRRISSQGQKGELSISEGSLLSAETGSILLDSTQSLSVQGELRAGESLQISAESIHLGEVEDGLSGLSLNNLQLSQLNPKELILTSRGDVNLHGGIFQVDGSGEVSLDSNGLFSPLRFNHLIVDAAGFTGFNNTNKQALISADAVTIRNTTGAKGITENGGGIFQLNADVLVLEGGDFNLSGFSSATFDIDHSITAFGETNLTVLNPVTINTSHLTGATGSKTVLSVPGNSLAINDNSTSELTNNGYFAAELKLLAASMTIDAPLLFRSGTVSAEASTGDVVLGNKAKVDVSGLSVPRGLSVPLQLAGGRIDLASQSGDVVAQAGSQMLLNGHTAEMAAGTLSLTTVQGQARLAGSIDAHGGAAAAGGKILLDTSNLGETSISSLNSIFSNSGFTDGISLRLRTGDLTVTETDNLTARNINLVVDNGALVLAGGLFAEGENGGNINLASGGRLTLTSSANLRADALSEGGSGGRVKLSSIAGGGIEIQNGTLINVAAMGGESGTVHFRADRQGSDVNIAPVSQGSVTGDPNVLVEAVRIYNVPNLDSTVINTIQSDTDGFMAALGANNVANAKFGSGYEILPGIEVRSDGDLILSSTWDLHDWRYGPNGAPGFLTLRAGGDIVLQQDLTDAFAQGAIRLGDLTGNPENNVAVQDMLQSGRSWSYNVIAGADFGSADNFATLTVGDIMLGNNVKVRTGTGDIGFYAGRDIVYGNDRSVVYTAGRPEDDNRFGFNLFYVVSRLYAEYPLDGGDITFRAGRNINGAITNQLASDWLIRSGNWSRESVHAGEWSTAWGVLLGNVAGSSMVADYRQNVGALGGGNISISAKGDISDLSVVIPTTGKQVGQPAQPDNLRNFNYLSNEIEINGGGDLNLTVGGDLLGGVFYVDSGIANLNIGGSMKAGSSGAPGVAAMNPVLALGDSKYFVTATGDITIDAIVDPMILPQPNNKRPGGLNSIFFRYGDDSAVTLTALRGNIELDNDVLSIIGMLNRDRSGTSTIAFPGDSREAIFVNPATLEVSALQGDVSFLNSLIMFPSAEGQFEIFAENHITTGDIGNNVNIAMSDADAGLLPSVFFPAMNYNDANLRLVSSGLSTETDKLFKSIPNHINDLTPVLISTGQGSIISNDPLLFVMAKPTQVMAGNDIRNVSFQIQHNFENSQSIISSGRDFKFDIERSSSTGAVINRVQKLEVSGPGELSVLAGRDIDLGSSQGVTTVGNQVNPTLAEDGASIDMLSGLTGTNIDIAGFTEKYFKDRGQFGEVYVQAAIEHMQVLTGSDTLSKSDALEAFHKLTPVQRAHFNARFFAPIRNVFNELVENQGKKFSIAKNSFDNTTDDDERFAFKQEMDSAQLEVLAAIESLFPGTTVLADNDSFTIDPENGIVFKDGNDADSIIVEAYSKERDLKFNGDISMFFSRVHSTDGGDINLYAPNGGINAGLAVSSGGARDASLLGIVAVKQGDIHSVVRDDFQVNTTRVMTLGGGDIVIGSTDGNIDAGRGAKTALAAPPPIVRFDERGNFIVELPPAVAGSGIRANVAPDGTQGDALLFALQGIIDASEAGVGGKDVTVGATAIVGSDNIDVGGVSIGVPVASTGSIAAGLGNVGNVAAAVAQAVESSADTARDASDKMASAAALGILSIDIVGFGDEEIE